MHEVDLFVIGGGSGGVRAARIAASLGAKVALCEERDLGGTCVNRGCVPKKLFAYASHTAHDLEIAKSFGYSVEGLRFDWTTLRDNKDKELERLGGVYERMLVKAGVEVIHGRGVLEDKHTVRVGETRYRAKNILIAVGGRPRPPAGEGGEFAITSDEIFHLETFPKKILIVGGGYIGVEFASIMNGLGVDTTLIVRGPKILRGFDEEVRDHLTVQLEKRGIKILPHHVVRQLAKNDEGSLRATLDHVTVKEHHPEVIQFDHQCDVVLAAIGRVPYTSKLGLETAGVDVDDAGNIIVNESFQTSTDHIYAVGDVIDRVQLTPVALVEGMFVAHRLFGDKRDAPSYANIPTAVFTSPEIGTVGLTEEDARKLAGEGGKLRIYTSRFRPMKITLSDEEERIFMKVIVDDKTDDVMGMHIVGPDAAELVQGFAVAINAGMKKRDLDRTIGIHPTAGEELLTMREPDRTVEGLA